MKTSKIIGILITILQIGGSVAFASSIHTMMSVYLSTIPEQEKIELMATDPVVIPFTLRPNNPGYMDAEVSVFLAIKSGETIVATNNAKVNILPHTQETLEIPLEIPLTQAQEYLLEDSSVQWVADIKVSTLFNLVSFSNRVTIMEATT
jgi:hypothetical protein